MRRTLALMAAAAAICGTGAATAVTVATASAQPAAGLVSANGALTCVRPTDTAAIDALLTSAGSPLAGQGAVFVSAGVQAGIDPRFLVAVAAQETMLATYGRAQGIHNPFGLGPGISFASYADAITTAAQTLQSGYLSQGINTIPDIAAKWAPPGVANDPQGLNQAWPSDVAHYYTTLGGNPSLPVALTDQTGDCSATGTPVTTSAPLVTVYPLGQVKGTFIQGPAQPGGTHDPAFNAANGSDNWQSIWAVDLGVPVGTPVYATFTGTIITEHSGGTGRFAGIGIGLDSGRGLAAYYAHLSTAYVAPGQNVVAGQMIGRTGEANGVAHLHFALGRSYSDGSPSNGLNPLPFLASAAPDAEAAQVRLADATALSPGAGTPVVTIWGGNTPVSIGSGPAGGNDPTSGQPATISPFAFPLALRPGGQVRYLPPQCVAGTACSVGLATPVGADVVAASAGTLAGPSAADQAEGIAFWIDTPTQGRIGYGPLAGYAHGIVAGATVSVGELLGTSAGRIAFAWQRGQVAINPWPLLTAVRPSN